MLVLLLVYKNNYFWGERVGNEYEWMEVSGLWGGVGIRKMEKAIDNFSM